MASYKLWRCTRQVKVGDAVVHDDEVFVSALTLGGAFTKARDDLPDIDSTIDIEQVEENIEIPF